MQMCSGTRVQMVNVTLNCVVVVDTHTWSTDVNALREDCIPTVSRDQGVFRLHSKLHTVEVNQYTTYLKK